MYKKTILTIALLICTFLMSDVYSQSFDNRKFIEVTGSAEMTLQPDEIELEIILLEYDKNGHKVNLDKINDDFIMVLKKNNIDTKTITLSNSNNYWWHWWYYRYQPYQTKTINIKLNSETNFLKLVEDLNEKWVQNITIAKSTNKDIYKYRKEVKMEAVKAAKEKATYLLESVGEQIGGVLSIEEIPEAQNYWFNQHNMVSNSNISVGSNNNNNAIDNVAVIKLKYEIKAKFEIK